MNNYRSTVFEYEAPERTVVYEAVVRYWREMGYPPTQEDIAKMTNKGKSTVRFHLDRLIEDGYLSYTPGVRRSLKIGPKPYPFSTTE
jgi:DNA-binding IclR family transcriptional regulator